METAQYKSAIYIIIIIYYISPGLGTICAQHLWSCVLI